MTRREGGVRLRHRGPSPSASETIWKPYFHLKLRMIIPENADDIRRCADIGRWSGGFQIGVCDYKTPHAKIIIMKITKKHGRVGYEAISPPVITRARHPGTRAGGQ